MAHSQKKIIKANAPFRSTILKQIIASLKKHSSVRQSTEGKGVEVDRLSSVSTQSQKLGKLALNEMQKYLQLISKMTEATIDIRRLNYLRLCLLKDEEEQSIIPFDFFLKTATKILNFPSFPESEIYRLMKDVLTDG